jgi:hypothetical protein
LSFAIRAESPTEEERRFQALRLFCEPRAQNLNENPQRRTAELVFDLDGVAILDWEDRKVRKVVVPAMGQWQTIQDQSTTFLLLELRSFLILLQRKILLRYESNSKSTMFGSEWNGFAHDVE